MRFLARPIRRISWAVSRRGGYALIAHQLHTYVSYSILLEGTRSMLLIDPPALNYRAALDAAAALCLHIGRQKRGASGFCVM